MPLNRRQWLGAGALLTCLGTQAQAAMLESVNIITGFAVGGTADAICRQVAAQLAPGYAKKAMVENRTGAAGQFAINYVVGRPADGRTLLQTSTALLAIQPHIQKKLGQQVELTPVSIGGKFDFGFAVGPVVPAQVRNLREFLEWARANPRAANFASPALGSTAHCIGALLAQQAGVDLQHVAYSGIQPALLDMRGGNIAAVLGPLGELLQHRTSTRLLGVSGAHRSRFAPEVATLVEQGWADMVHSEWMAFFLPAKASPELALRLNGHLRVAFASADVVDRLDVLGVEAMSSTPAELAALVQSERVKWAGIVQRLGLTVES